ncbi:MAG: hypothetical protein GC162_19390 [Planctomycetes bacterium]|nr:hypothetical protein [Planctomycetota bacterium]
MHIVHLIDHREEKTVTALREDLAGALAGVSHELCRVEAGPLAAMRLRSALRRTKPGDVVHAWSLRAAAIGAMSGIRSPMTATIAHMPTASDARWLMRRALRRRAMTLTAIDAPIAGAIASRCGLEAHIIPPGLDARRIERGDRRAMRMRWGITDETMLMATVLGDAAEPEDELRGALAVGLVEEAGRKLRVMLRAGSTASERARRLMDATRRGERMRITPDLAELWRVIDGCDLAIGVGGGLPLAWAMLAGKAIAGMDSEHVRAYVRADVAGLLAPPHSPGELAKRICRLADDPARRRELSQAAQTAATECFDLNRYAQRMHHIYDRTAAGAPIDWPALAAAALPADAGAA